QPGIGRYLTPGSPLSFARHARQSPSPAPELGAHTEEVLADVAGLPDHDIAALFDRGIASASATPTRLAS
ncbi:MAG: 2-methylfumaryl-CoA isomerase, partial [Octadecabacter sp.]|nr:2-methylfumaryl-CoA isomerase [Octadecabacter sp.]